MINKPGTLLVVRKHIKGKATKRRLHMRGKNGIIGVFHLEPSGVARDNYKHPGKNPMRYDPVDLPYGAAVVLLDLLDWPSRRSKNMKLMRLLYGEKHIVGHISSHQCDKWFTFPRNWNKYYAKKIVTNPDT